jgi:Zn-dependent protease
VGRNSAWLLFALALGLLVLPIWWVFAAVLAAVWHEACHYFALRLCGGRAFGLRAGLTGAVMDVRFNGPGQELICALSGPAGSLLLLLFVRWMPRTAICGGFQGIYNLLPIYPLDGGRAMRCLSEIILTPIIGQKLCFWVEKACLLGLVILSLYGCFGLHLGIAPLLVGAGIIWRVKIPCKPWRNSVQWIKKLQ